MLQCMSHTFLSILSARVCNSFADARPNSVPRDWKLLIGAVPKTEKPEFLAPSPLRDLWFLVSRRALLLLKAKVVVCFGPTALDFFGRESCPSVREGSIEPNSWFSADYAGSKAARTPAFYGFLGQKLRGFLFRVCLTFGTNAAFVTSTERATSQRSGFGCRRDSRCECRVGWHPGASIWLLPCGPSPTSIGPTW